MQSKLEKNNAIGIGCKSNIDSLWQNIIDKYPPTTPAPNVKKNAEMNKHIFFIMFELKNILIFILDTVVYIIYDYQSFLWFLI